jgi:hypothetical protein
MLIAIQTSCGNSVEAIQEIFSDAPDENIVMWN